MFCKKVAAWKGSRMEGGISSFMDQQGDYLENDTPRQHLEPDVVEEHKEPTTTTASSNHSEMVNTGTSGDFQEPDSTTQGLPVAAGGSMDWEDSDDPEAYGPVRSNARPNFVPQIDLGGITCAPGDTRRGNLQSQMRQKRTRPQTPEKLPVLKKHITSDDAHDSDDSDEDSDDSDEVV